MGTQSDGKKKAKKKQKAASHVVKEQTMETELIAYDAEPDPEETARHVWGLLASSVFHSSVFCLKTL